MNHTILPSELKPCSIKYCFTSLKVTTLTWNISAKSLFKVNEPSYIRIKCQENKWVRNFENYFTSAWSLMSSSIIVVVDWASFSLIRHGTRVVWPKFVCKCPHLSNNSKGQVTEWSKKFTRKFLCYSCNLTVELRKDRKSKILNYENMT